MLLALGITKPVIRTVIFSAKNSVKLQSSFLPNIICYKVKKEPFSSQRPCLKTQLPQEKPKPNQTDRTLKPYSGLLLLLLFFREGGEKTERAHHCSIFDQKTLEQSKNSFFFQKRLIKAYTVILSMQSYKILHFCFLLGYIGYLQGFLYHTVNLYKVSPL